MNCIQNPTVGREKIWGIGTIKPAEVRRKILIVGGGPAGLETARVAGLRGHEVVIYDKREEVGGRVRLQATLPRMAEIGNIASWLESQARKAGARIVTGKEVTADNLKTVLSEETPDAVVVATGAEGARDGMNGFLCQEIPGWQQENVYTYEDVVEGKIGDVRKVLLLDELSDELALGVARQLAAYAEEVQLITRHISIGQSPYVSHVNIRRELKAIYQLKNIKIVPYTFITGIEGRNVRLLFTPIDEERLEEDVDAVVLMTMFKSNNSLYPLVKDKVAEAHLIGDARAPRTTHEAIMEGQRLGRKL